MDSEHTDEWLWRVTAGEQHREEVQVANHILFDCQRDEAVRFVAIAHEKA